MARPSTFPYRHIPIYPYPPSPTNYYGPAKKTGDYYDSLKKTSSLNKTATR